MSSGYQLKIIIAVKERVFSAASEGSFVYHLPMSIAWCDVTQVYYFKTIAIDSYACYLGCFLCAAAIAYYTFIILSPISKHDD